MKFIPEEGKHLHEDCSTLILPAVSIGNVGQLTADLLVSSMGSEKVGYLDDPYVLPCVGNDAYGPVPNGDLALPIEAYDSPSNALTIIQQRSPVIKGMMLEFAKNMADFIAGSGKKHIIILSSLDFGKWQKVDMSSGLQIYYLSSANSNGADENCEQLGWKKLQDYDPSQKHWKYLNDLAEGNATPEDTISIEDELEEENYYASLPFAALFSFLKVIKTGPMSGPVGTDNRNSIESNRKMLMEGEHSDGLGLGLMHQAKGLKVTCLLCYCSEGDNTSDAFQLADAACKLLKPNQPNSGIEGVKWRVPLSWMSVYGPPPDVSIF
ncbi:proteasome assembly chaperone 2-like protein [Trifolium pratense]|uniref:Proteasome assembly chaperone 2 n=2 Tax=Trifolium TaxID=3898 RepID=A0A2K3PLU2_TRIPR|nr:proteasome assembly chaperone 2-like protein [Trifolium pratense]